MLFSQWYHEPVPYHPAQETPNPATWQGLCRRFQGCDDFATREVQLRGSTLVLRLAWVDGMIKSERLNDYVIRPLAAAPQPVTETALTQLLLGGVWNLNAEKQTDLGAVIAQLIDGAVAVFLPSGGVITCSVPTEEKRSIDAPENETEVKGAKDSFVESLRTNTSLIRRRLRSPDLRVGEETVGRRTATPVDILWVEGITDPALVEGVRQRLGQMDVDGLLAVAELEEGLVGPKRTAFPRTYFTERPDRASRALLDGRVVVMADGIPLACVLPCVMADFLQAPQDRSWHFLAASCLLVLRYLCLLVTLILPGAYIAIASFHFEMIPTEMAQSIISAKQQVPFSTQFEVLGMLLAFEILQEAGQRLPKTIGQTVSIIGSLVVGQAAADAKLISPVVIIVVAAAGITGFTIPDQGLSNALRIWRFLLALAASAAGLFGISLTLAVLVLHLAGLETMGCDYLAPFTGGVLPTVRTMMRGPMDGDKLRDTVVGVENVRKRR
jgi:spore germination protein KA